MNKATPAREQILVLDPSQELKFKGPFTTVVTSQLNITNPSSHRVLFKVKTTAPKRYCVRPNSGILEPGTTVAVGVMLQPFDHDLSEHNKHRFMVQSMLVLDQTANNPEQLWKEAKSSELMDSKLKCVFEVSADGAKDVNVGREDDEKITSSKTVLSTVRSSSISSSTSKAEDEVTDTRKLVEERQKLLNDVERLCAENACLKSDGARLRDLALSDTVSSTPSQTKLVRASVTAEDQVFVIPAPAYLITILIVGILIGKLLL